MAKSKGQLEDRAVCARPSGRETQRPRWSVVKKIQAVLLIIGLGLSAIYVAVRAKSYFASRAAIESFESAELAPAAEEAVANDDSQAGDPDFSAWGEGRIRAYVNAATRAGGAPLALLQIPKIHLQAPVFDGTDGLTLNHSVGRIAGTAKPGDVGNIGLAAHRDGFFRGLKDIQKGDEIDLKTHRGIDTYTVDQIQIVSPRDVSVLQDQGKQSLTLVTCYPFYFIGSAPKRYVVTAFLTQHATAGSIVTDTRLNSQPLNPTQQEEQ